MHNPADGLGQSVGLGLANGLASRLVRGLARGLARGLRHTSAHLHPKQRRGAALLQRARPAVLAMLALALPCAAFPYSLQDLLRLPLERLLQLEISAPVAPGAAAPAARPKARSPRG